MAPLEARACLPVPPGQWSPRLSRTLLRSHLGYIHVQYRGLWTRRGMPMPRASRQVLWGCCPSGSLAPASSCPLEAPPTALRCPGSGTARKMALKQLRAHQGKNPHGQTETSSLPRATTPILRPSAPCQADAAHASVDTNTALEVRVAWPPQTSPVLQPQCR